MEKEISIQKFRFRLVLGVLSILAMILATFTGMYFYAAQPDPDRQIASLLAEEQTQIQQIRFEALSLLQSKDEDDYNTRKKILRKQLGRLNDIRRELRSRLSQDADLLTSPLSKAIFAGDQGLDPQLKEWTRRGFLLAQTAYPQLSPANHNLTAILQVDQNGLDSAFKAVWKKWEDKTTSGNMARLRLFLSGGAILFTAVLIISLFLFRPGWMQMAGFLRSLDQNNQQLQSAATMLEEKKGELEIRKLQLQAALDSVTEGVLIELKDDPQPIYNQKLVELLEIPDSILLSNNTEGFRRFLQEKLPPAQRKQLSIGIPFRGEANLQLALNGGRVLETVSRPMELGGRQLGRVWSFRDISNHVADKQVFAEKILRFQQILNSMAEGFIIIDPKRYSLYLNPAAEQVFGVYPHCKELSKWPEHYGIYQPGKRELFPPEQTPIATSLQGVSSDEVVLYIKNSKIKDGCYISASGRPVYNKAGQLLCGVITFRMVDEPGALLSETAPAAEQESGRLYLYIDEHLRILPDFSPELCQRLNSHCLAGMNIVELFETGPADIDPPALREYLEFCFQPEFSREFVDRLNPLAAMHIPGQEDWQSTRELRTTVERIYSGERIARLKISFELVAEPQNVSADWPLPGEALSESLHELLRTDSVELERIIQDCAYSLAGLLLFVQNDRFEQLIVSDYNRFREYIDRLSANELMSQYEAMESEMQTLRECLEEIETHPDRATVLKSIFRETIESLHSNLDEFTNLYRFVKENSTLNIEDENLKALLN